MEPGATKRLAALIQGEDHLCYRYRLAAFAPALAARGWTIDPVVIPPGSLATLQLHRRLAAADVVLLQRRLFAWLRLGLVRRSAQLLVFDFDDAVYCRDTASARPAESAGRQRRFRSVIRQADAITAGNAHLIGQAIRAGGAGKTHYFPTCIDAARYPLAEHRQSRDVIRLAWIGDPRTLHSLDAARACLAEVCREAPALRLRVICSAFPELPGVPVEPCVWSSASEVADLAACDIGVSWLPEHPWSLGKCGLKVLQYMAAGLPVVANRVGVHRDLVRDGETGFLADTPQEWRTAVARLAASVELRRRLGKAGREWIARHYGVARWGRWLAQFLDDLRAGRQSTNDEGT